MWQTEPTMLIERWEHLRGYDKWTQTNATVQSVSLSRVGEIGGSESKPPIALGWESVCEIRWRDQDEIEHVAEFRAYEESPLYQLSEGNTLTIRYNPSNPSEYLIPGLLTSELTRTWRLVVYAVMLIVLGIGLLVFLYAH